MIAFMMLNSFRLPFPYKVTDQNQYIENIKNKPIDFSVIKSDSGSLKSQKFC